jgi:hypothetical protein
MATPKKPGAQRGRPLKSFLNDPDRHVVAFAMALQACGVSERTAFLATSALMLGRRIEERERPASRKRGVGKIPGGKWVTYERIQGGLTPASFENYANTMRKKAARAMDDPESAAWLRGAQLEVARTLSAMPELIPQVQGDAVAYDEGTKKGESE